jgi:hypothetical protein
MVSKLKRPPTEWVKKFVVIHQRTNNQNIQGAPKTKFLKNQRTNKEVGN